MRSVPWRPILELVAAAATLLVAVALVAAPDWIERLTGLDPDAGSGAVEAGVVAVLMLATLGLALRAGRALRRRPSVPPATREDVA